MRLALSQTLSGTSSTGRSLAAGSWRTASPSVPSATTAARQGLLSTSAFVERIVMSAEAYVGRTSPFSNGAVYGRERPSRRTPLHSSAVARLIPVLRKAAGRNSHGILHGAPVLRVWGSLSRTTV